MWCAYVMMVLLIECPLSFTVGSGASTSKMFDCRRDDRLCSNHGSCDIVSGECRCHQDYRNFDCGLAIADIPTTCGKVCANGGTCYIQGQGGNESCSCALGYYGDECHEKRGDLKCEASKFIVYLTPLTVPARVYVPGYKDDAGCNAMNIGSESQTFYAELSFFSACGGGTNTTDLMDYPNTGDRTFRNWLVVQYNEYFHSPLDNLYILECTITENEIYNLTVGMSVQSMDKRKNEHKFLVQSQYDGIIFQILNSERKVIDGPVFSGTPLTLRVRLQSKEVYSAVRFDRCIASERYGGGGEQILLVARGCVVRHAPASHAQFLDPITPGPQQTLPVGAIRFGNTPIVHISCSVIMCKDPSHCSLRGFCSPHPFIGGFRGTRRKRSLDTTDKKVTLSVEISIVDDNSMDETKHNDGLPTPDSTEDKPIQQNYGRSSSLKHLWFYLLGAVMFVFGVFIFITTIKFLNPRERYKKMAFIQNVRDNLASK